MYIHAEYSLIIRFFILHMISDFDVDDHNKIQVIIYTSLDLLEFCISHRMEMKGRKISRATTWCEQRIFS